MKKIVDGHLWLQKPVEHYWCEWILKKKEKIMNWNMRFLLLIMSNNGYDKDKPIDLGWYDHLHCAIKYSN